VEEQLAACPYCADAGLQGQLCNQCGVDEMIYNDPVDKNYLILKYNEDAEEDDEADK